MSKFWQKKYISKYTGAEIDAAVEKTGDLSKVEANPELAGTEAALTGLEVGETKYKVEQPINVVANPTLAGTEAALEGLQVGETKYAIPAGGGGVFPFTAVIDWDHNTVTLNKTFAQIKAAYNNGDYVFGYDDQGDVYKIGMIPNASEIVFVSQYMIYESSSLVLESYTITLADDDTNTFEYSEYTISATPIT